MTRWFRLAGFLCRSELTPTQEAEHLAKRKEVWEAMEAAKIPVAQVAPVEIGYGKPPPRPEGFATETAAITGKNKATINRAIRRANKVCQEARDLIRGTGLDTGAYLDRLALAYGTADPPCRIFAVPEQLRPAEASLSR